MHEKTLARMGDTSHQGYRIFNGDVGSLAGLGRPALPLPFLEGCGPSDMEQRGPLGIKVHITIHFIKEESEAFSVCLLKYAAGSVFASLDGSTCHYWYPPTQWSQMINVDTGSTYFISIWTFLASVPYSSKTGSSIVDLITEAPGRVPGSGAVVLSVANSSITPDLVQSTKMRDLDAHFVRNVCGSTDDSATVSYQFAISTGYGTRSVRLSAT
ncbi:hypothetical protein TruAng_011840 [Truncatella angustata]|nr:hypothetical protein TruAng_011840 [Truncatella angustata]